MRQQYWYGMSAKLGTVLAGVFTIVATEMYLIFEEKYIRGENCSDLEWAQSETKMISLFLMCWGFEIVLLVSLVTCGVSVFLLYSVYAEVFRGLLVYIIWIILYEVMNIIIQFLTNTNPKIRAVRVMRWFGLMSRIFMQCFWMFFVLTHAYTLHKSKTQGHILTYDSRVSPEPRSFLRRKSETTFPATRQ
ncbi:PREDICTED: transmembrane protein 217 [Elephantulus edwardii]|uniref:transmembrane protein 217 n=1 Tax=Elephantulus edwardii TaxID=28737 RepID=UPI0003F0B4E2|nr:PREDICTED: transmembrane protein 217 [Elephantulus edwardii]